MSSSTGDAQSFFVVQSGVVAWEDPEPIVDWRRKTITICAAQLSLLSSAMSAIVLSRPALLRSVFRFHMGSAPVDVGVGMRRRIFESFRKDPPGFSKTYVATVGNQICVASELTDPASLDLNYLSTYRSTILVEVDPSINSPENLCGIFCGTVGDLGGSGIARVLDRPEAMAILRVIERESHAAIQLIGSSETSTRAVAALTSSGMRQVHDVRTLSAEIARLRTV